MFYLAYIGLNSSEFSKGESVEHVYLLPSYDDAQILKWALAKDKNIEMIEIWRKDDPDNLLDIWRK